MGTDDGLYLSGEDNPRSKIIAESAPTRAAHTRLLALPLMYQGEQAMDAITHLAVPQVAMINDMLEMVQNG